MQRRIISPRANWEEKIKAQGFLFYKQEAYYSETCAYEFTAAEVDAIEHATAEIFDMCLAVVEHVIKSKLWDEFFIPKQYAELIEWSWNEDQPSFYGRLDLAYRDGHIKLLEFNADTPTSLLEASVVQWYWLQEYNKDLDQYNSIHEKLIDSIHACRPYMLSNKLFFTCVKGNIEDFMTVKYLEDIASQAGMQTSFQYIEDIGIDYLGQFATSQNELIQNIFKLYPYEWMFHEEFGQKLISNKDKCYWIEPAYKSLLSNKMLLKYLYDLFPDSPYILPCTFIPVNGTGAHPKDYVKKPIFSREGANVTIVVNDQVLEANGGEYGEEGHVYQEYFALPNMDGNKPVIGSWLIGGVPAGMGIRESLGLITNNTSRFCPHYFI